MATITQDDLGTINQLFDNFTEKIKDLLHNEYVEGRLTDNNYALVYAKSIDSIISQSAQMVTTFALLPKEQDSKDLENQIKKYQLDYLLPDEHLKNQKQLAVMDKQIEGQAAEIEYTNARKDTVLESRIDNLVLETLKAFQDKIASVGNAGLVPSTNDFENELLLLQQAWRRARKLDVEHVDLTTSGTWTKL